MGWFHPQNSGKLASEDEMLFHGQNVFKGQGGMPKSIELVTRYEPPFWYPEKLIIRDDVTKFGVN